MLLLGTIHDLEWKGSLSIGVVGIEVNGMV